MLLMVIMHAMVQLENAWGLRMWVLHWSWYPWLHLIFSGSFIFIAGICCNFTKSNLRRGCLALGCAMAITAVSFLPVMYGAPIYFGVLHCLGTMMVIYGLFENTAAKIIWHPVTLPVWLILFAICFSWYQTAPDGSWLTLIVGMPPAIFMGDYYPLIPYLPLFFAGAAVGKPIADGHFPTWFYDARLPFLSGVGKNALIVYIAHLPVVYLLLLIFFGWPK